MRMITLLACLVLSACSHVAVTELSPQANSAATTTIGSPILEWSWKVSPLPGSNGWKKELVFLGSDGPRVRVAYREYTNAYSGRGWLVKPGFSNELVFNMEDAKEIVYQDARVRVDSWSPGTIAYTVVQAPRVD